MTLVLNGTTGVSSVDGSAGTPAVQGGDSNTGLFFPAADTVAIATGGTERARVDSAGNVGIGVTPSAWGGGNRGVIDLGTQGAVMASTSVGTATSYNAYFDGTNWAYKASGSGATRYTGTSTTHAWYTAPSGTAGNAITFTQAMTLTAGGNLLVGTTTDPGDRIYASGSIRAVTVKVDGGAYITGPGSDILALYAGSSERARIDSSGNLLVGTTATINAAKAVIQFTSASNGLYLDETSGTSGTQFIRFNQSGTGIGSITRNAATNAVLYNTTSDYRLKQNVTALSGGLDRVMALRPVQWVWKDCGGATGEGFIAHEVQEICPAAVSGEKDAVDKEGNITPQGMDASYLVATLTAAIQEQQSLIESLTARIAALEGAAQ
jgi:hypothetical protein